MVTTESGMIDKWSDCTSLSFYMFTTVYNKKVNILQAHKTYNYIDEADESSVSSLIYMIQLKKQETRILDTLLEHLKSYTGYANFQSSGCGINTISSKNMIFKF